MTVFFLNTVIFLKVFTKIIAVLFTAVSSQNNITRFFGSTAVKDNAM